MIFIVVVKFRVRSRALFLTSFLGAGNRSYEFSAAEPAYFPAEVKEAAMGAREMGTLKDKFATIEPETIRKKALPGDRVADRVSKVPRAVGRGVMAALPQGDQVMRVAGFDVKLVNTAAIEQYEGLKYSGDEHDARHLAHSLRLELLRFIYAFEPECPLPFLIQCTLCAASIFDTLFVP